MTTPSGAPSGPDVDWADRVTGLIKSGKAVLVAGAGVSMAVGGPSGPQLIQRVTTKFGVPAPDDLRQAVQEILDQRLASREQIEDYIESILGNLRPDDRVRELCAYPWAAFFTTNFDPTLREALASQDAVRFKLVKEDNVNVNVLDPTRRFLFHVMGVVEERARGRGRMVLSQSDYEDALRRRRRYFDLLTEAVRDGAVVFLGYSFKDRIVLDIARDIETREGPDSIPPIYALFPDPDAIDEATQRKFSAKNILPVRADIDGILRVLKERWTATPSVPPPSELFVKVNDRLVSVDRTDVVDLGPYIQLLTSGLATNDDGSTAPAFLRGETNSWSPFQKDWDLRRDPKNATATTLAARIRTEMGKRDSKDNVILVLAGDPGSGKSVAARRLAFDAAYSWGNPTLYIRDLGFTPKHVAIDQLIERTLARYSDSVEKSAGGEEVKFLIIVDDSGKNPTGAIHLFNFLTGNARPVLLLIVARGERPDDTIPYYDSYSSLIPASSFFYLKDRLEDREIAHLGAYLRRLGFIDLDDRLLRSVVSSNYGNSLFSSLYGFVDPTRPPLTEVQKGLYSSLTGEGQGLFRKVAAFHQYGHEPPLELIRRSEQMRLDQLSSVVSRPPGCHVLVLTDSQSGPTTIRTVHRILAARLLQTYEPDTQEQTQTLLSVLSSVNLASEYEREFVVGFLVRVCGHRATSDFSREQRRGLFSAVLEQDEDQVLLHHLALLEQDEGKLSEAARLLERALERGRATGVREEAEEVLLTSFAGVRISQGLEALKSGSTGIGEGLLQESREMLHRVQASTREVGPAYHREALLNLQLSRVISEDRAREALLQGGLSIVEHGLDASQDEDAQMALHSLAADIYSALGLASGMEASVDAVVKAAEGVRNPFVASSYLRRASRLPLSPENRTRLLRAASDRIEAALRGHRDDANLLREEVLLLQELQPTSFSHILNSLSAYLAQDPNPAPLMMFRKGVCAFQLKYFDQARAAFGESELKSRGLRDRSRTLTSYVDEKGRVLRLTGVVEEARNPKYGRIRVTSGDARGQLIEFSPIGFPGRPRPGQAVTFRIDFTMRGPIARPM